MCHLHHTFNSAMFLTNYLILFPFVESVGLIRSKTPPPIKPKKRYNATELPNDDVQNEINRSLNMNQTFNLPQTSYQLKIRDKSDPSIQLVVRDKQKYLAETPYENLDEKTDYQSEKMNLLQDITQELETRFVYCVLNSQNQF